MKSAKLEEYLRGLLVAQIATLNIMGSCKDITALENMVDKLTEMLDNLEQED
mgnify:CR=1 FL=1